jgi:hypothetical protein
MRITRAVLVVFGILVLMLGAVTLFQTVSTKQIGGLLVWFVGALILHDGVISFVVFGVGLGMRKYGRRIPLAVLAIVQAGLVVASVLAIIALPEVYKKMLGTKNDTVLPFNYGIRLLIVWAGVAVLTGLAVALYLRVLRRRTKLRLSVTQV